MIFVHPPKADFRGRQFLKFSRAYVSICRKVNGGKGELGIDFPLPSSVDCNK